MTYKDFILPAIVVSITVAAFIYIDYDTDKIIHLKNSMDTPSLTPPAGYKGIPVTNKPEIRVSPSTVAGSYGTSVLEQFKGDSLPALGANTGEYNYRSRLLETYLKICNYELPSYVKLAYNKKTRLYTIKWRDGDSDGMYLACVGDPDHNPNNIGGGYFSGIAKVIETNDTCQLKFYFSKYLEHMAMRDYR